MVSICVKQLFIEETSTACCLGTDTIAFFWENILY
jgi:hypothetical protein